MRTPDFWYRDDSAARLIGAALAPLGWIYGASVAWKTGRAMPRKAGVPVICIGNLTAGGTGKTPVSVAVAKMLKARCHCPWLLSRGYGGTVEGPHVVGPTDTAGEVGDEPMLLSAELPVVVSRDRKAGADLAAEKGAGVIVMDDGHQNFSLAKDLTIVVIDAEQKFGNGLMVPAGPLREPVAQGLARADAVVLMGDGEVALNGFKGPVIRGRLVPDPDEDFHGRDVVAFAGIGNPEKFFRSLRSVGANIVEAVPFEDHHPFTDVEIAHLKNRARKENAKLVTTGKDYVRLNPDERIDVSVLPVRAEFAEIAELERLLDRLFLPR